MLFLLRKLNLARCQGYPSWCYHAKYRINSSDLLSETGLRDPLWLKSRCNVNVLHSVARLRYYSFEYCSRVFCSVFYTVSPHCRCPFPYCPLEYCVTFPLPFSITGLHAPLRLRLRYNLGCTSSAVRLVPSAPLDPVQQLLFLFMPHRTAL